MSVNHSARSGGIIGIYLFHFLSYEVMLCVLIKSDFNEYTQYTIFNNKRKSVLIISNVQLWDFFQDTKERVRNSFGK